jgi:hypothetical protein
MYSLGTTAGEEKAGKPFTLVFDILTVQQFGECRVALGQPVLVAFEEGYKEGLLFQDGRPHKVAA